MERHQKNAVKIAEFLESHPKVKKVNYPGLKSHPQYELNKRLASGTGAIISFEYDGDLKETINVVESTQIFKLAESLGAVGSLIEHPRTMSHGSVPPEQLTKVGISENLIRLSVGIENVDDLIDDIDHALRS
jgi:cystathionine gamma-lyase